MRTRDPDLSPRAAALSAVLGSLVGSFSVVSTVWLAVVGFTGGTVPVLGWSLPGGLGPGLAWLAVLATAGVVVLWIVPVACSMAVYAAVSRLLTPTVLGRPPRRARHHRFPTEHAA